MIASLRHRTPWTLAAAALALTVAGCTATVPPPPPMSASTPPAAPEPTGSTGSTAPTSSSSGAAEPDREPTRECRLPDLRASIDQAGPQGPDHVVRITWTNTSSRSCSMSGFGGIDLEGPPDPMGPVYSVRRAEIEQLPTVELAPRGTATTRLYWLPASGPGGWTPTRMRITPPNETRSAVLSWPRVADNTVLRQDGATRPGTYFYPVTPAS